MSIALRAAAAVLALAAVATAWSRPAAAHDPDPQAMVRDLLVETPRPKPRREAASLGAKLPMGAGLMSTAPLGLRLGDPVRLRLVALNDGYGHLYALSASGRTQLWLENVRLNAGEPIAFPGGRRVLRATAPAGDEKLVFIATRYRLDGFAGRRTTRAPIQLALSHAQFDEALTTKLADVARADWVRTETTLHIKD